MTWFVFAFAAGIASAANVWASKVLVTRDLKPITVGGVVHVWAGLLCLAAMPFVPLRAELTPLVLLGVLGMGCVYVVGNALYFTALKKAELSEIDLFLRTSSLWTFLLGVALLGESAASRTMLGAALIVSSVLLLTNQQRRIRFDRAGLLALGAALAFGLGNVVDKALSPSFDALSYTVVNLLLTGCGMLLIARAHSSDLFTPELRGKTALTVSATFALTQLLIILAFGAGGTAGEVILVAQGRLLILLAVGILVLKERNRITRKLVAGVIMLMGIALLSAV